MSTLGNTDCVYTVSVANDICENVTRCLAVRQVRPSSPKTKTAVNCMFDMQLPLRVQLKMLEIVANEGCA